MKIIIGIVIIGIIALVVGCDTPSNPFPTQSESIPAPSSKTEPLRYEVVKTYTIEVVGDSSRRSTIVLTLVTYPKACVEIKNTDNVGGLFSVNFFFSEEYFGRDLIYLKPGETGVATYTAVMTEAHFPTDNLKEFREQTAKWEYEITPVVLNP